MKILQYKVLIGLSLLNITVYFQTWKYVETSEFGVFNIVLLIIISIIFQKLPKNVWF